MQAQIIWALLCAAATSKTLDTNTKERGKGDAKIVLLFQTTCLDIATQAESFNANVSNYLSAHLPSETPFLLETNCDAEVFCTEMITLYINFVGSAFQDVDTLRKITINAGLLQLQEMKGHAIDAVLVVTKGLVYHFENDASRTMNKADDKPYLSVHAKKGPKKGSKSKKRKRRSNIGEIKHK
eukprot:m.255633 g.255633  ORF g.255633 m.255633 type:complete len:183 (+) comp16183_c1_seq9:82-630(+)